MSDSATPLAGRFSTTEPPGKPLSVVQGVIFSASPKLFSSVISLLGLLLSFCIFLEAEVLMEMLILPWD